MPVMSNAPVMPGLDVLSLFATAPHDLHGTSENASFRNLELLRGKRIGLVTNHTGRTKSGVSTLEILRLLKLQVSALFSPEHGPHGTCEGDIESARSDDGTPIYSLYGATRRPTDVMLENLDALVFDIQDVGARFYTYSTTLAFCMEECAARGLSFVVLDRPNPLGGDCVDGPIVTEEARSFIGHLQVPVRHGMTLGELALWHRADAALDLDLHVVPVANWRRSMLWPDTGLSWIAPSPNLPDFESTRWYPATCLLEFSNISVGRGTSSPFQIIGAPWLNAQFLISASTSWPAEIRRGITLKAINFTPKHSVFEGENCRGLWLQVRENAGFVDGGPPVASGLALLQTLFQTHPTHFGEEQLQAALPLLGSPRVLERLRSGSLEEAVAYSEEDVSLFQMQRAPYLMYE